MTSSSTGSCPACPTSCASGSSARAEACRCTRSRPCGCCSTAGCSSRRTACYRPTGEVAELEVPETLHGLIAARLDGLAAEERRLLQDASVLGKTFAQGRRSPHCPGSRGRARSAALGSRAQGGARRPGRPALARARPVRLPAGPRPARRLRDARPSRPEDATPRRGGAARSERSDEPSRRSSRWSPLTTSPPTRPNPTPTMRAEIKANARELLARAAERAGSARRGRRSRSARSSRRRS